MSHLKQPTPCGNDGWWQINAQRNQHQQPALRRDMTVLLARCKCPCGSNEEQSRHEIDSNATVTSASLATRISLHNKQNKKDLGYFNSNWHQGGTATVQTVETKSTPMPHLSHSRINRCVYKRVESRSSNSKTSG